MPSSAEEEWTYWDTKATELRRKQLETVQTAATKWSTLLTALLGVATAVAFAGGLTTIDNLSDPYATIARVLTTIAILLAIAATILFAIAGGGLSARMVQGINAEYVRDIFIGGAEGALGAFRWARRLALSAATVVIAGSFMVLWVGEAEAAKKPPTVLATFADGHTTCGVLGGTAEAVTIGGTAVNGQVTQMLIVDACS